MNTPLPRLAWPLGLAGLLPFLAGLVAVSLGQGWAAFALAAYGAAILSFLGAVHWGLALAAPEQAAGTRLIGGVMPSLVAWLALLAPLPVGLALLGAGLIALVVAETIAARAGLLPWAYLWLRWVLSGVAAVCLLATACIT
jgi:hypothetical protein